MLKPFLAFLPLLIIVGLGCVVVQVLKGRFPEKKGALPYLKKDSILSAAENSFYLVLCQIMPKQYHIFPKIRLADIVDVKKLDKSEWQKAFNRVQSKHVDFIVCDDAAKPLVVIELDDKSHNTQKAKRSDEFKDELFKQVGVRLVRVKAQKAYSTEEIKSLLFKPIPEEKKEVEAN